MSAGSKVFSILLAWLFILSVTGFSQTSVDLFAARAFDGGLGFATGDLNTDGRLDVVAVRDDRINLKLGNGTGRFPTTATVFACDRFSSNALKQPFVRDFTGDGRIDIASLVDDPSCTIRGNRVIMVLPGNGNGTFAAPVFTDISSFFFTPNQYATADFNGDGRVDIAVAIAFSGTFDKVAIFLNNGNGTFAAPAEYVLTGSQSGFNLTVGDFNNDNRPDLVFGRRSPADIAMLLNNGDGTFGLPFTIITGTSDPKGAARIDSDANLDLVTVRYVGNSMPIIQVWRGNGNSTFSSSPGVTLTVEGTDVGRAVIGDVTGDGNADIAVPLVNRTMILRGNGTGAMAEDQLYGVGGGRLFEGDFNSDGALDLATTQPLGFEGSLIGTSSEFAVLLNLNNGTFLTAPALEIPFGGDDMALADFNSDKLLDIAFTGDRFNGEIVLLLQDPSAGFSDRMETTSLRNYQRGLGLVPRTIATGDFNADSKTDVVVAGRAPSGTTENVVVARNDGMGNLSLFSTLSVAGDVNKVIVGHFNGDGHLDLAFGAFPAVSVAYGSGTGTFSAPVSYPLANSLANGLVAADINGDGHQDLAAALNNRSIAMLINNAGGGFAGGAVYELAGMPTDIGAAFMNNDGNADLVVAHNLNFIADSARVSVFGGVGNGTFEQPIHYPTVWLHDQRMAIADYSGDGKPDVALTHNGVVSVQVNNGGAFGEKVVWASTGALRDIAPGDLNNDGKTDLVTSSALNSFHSLGFLQNISQAAPQSAAPFDFDGDGKTDVGIFRPSAPTGAEWWYQRSSNGQVPAVQFGLGTDKMVPGDFTGDGKTDIAFWRPSDGNWFVLRSEDSTFLAFPFGSNGDIPAPADYDADGKADAAVFRPTTTTWFISNSGGSGTSILNFGISTDKPVVTDYDGDAKADIAIWRSGPGEWWVRRSTNGSVLAVQFGTTSDRPVQGDYTGDGKADIAFWRPTDGNWFIIRSEDSSFLAFPFGSSGDTPVPGDYDGDGKMDAAAFRPTSATWFLNRSTAGVAIQQFGLPTDTPIPSAYLP